MLTYGPEILEEKRNMFFDILNTNGEVNIDWIREQKAHFDSIYKSTQELYERFNRDKGKVARIIKEKNIPAPLYFDEYDLEDIKDLIHSRNVKDELTKVNLHKLVNKLIVINKEIGINIARLDNIIKQVSNKKGIKNVDHLETDTFDEHYYDIDAIREERGIILDKPNKIVSSETLFTTEDEDIEYTFDGTKSLEDISLEIYGASRYWKNIFNYEDNIETIKKALNTRNIDLDKVEKDPKYLKGISLKIPNEIVHYTDEFDTQVLKTIKL